MSAANLNQANLAAIAAPGPSYSRNDLKPGIVHIGLGHFHRAHQAVYLDELLCRGLARTGIFAVNLLPDPWPLGETAKAQDYLYTLITRGADGEETVRVIGSILAYQNAGEGIPAVIERLAAEETKLITLTVTEHGYHHRPGGLDWTAPALIHDRENPGAPESVMGFLAAALDKRKRARGKPLTIMSCDNIPHNGRMLKEGLLCFCRELYPDLVSWIEDTTAFPNSMVDRITPGTTGEIIQYLEEKFSLIDRWPVRSEDFRQWVLENNFKEGTPDYGAAGVQVVKDVEPYELMKIRLLNGSHSALAYPAYLLGHRGVAEAILDKDLAVFIRRFYMEETARTLGPVEGIDLNGYKDILVSRFSNKNITDTVLRLASDGSKKIALFMINPLTEAINRGLPHQAIIFALSAWARFLGGEDEAGKSIPLEDPRGAELVPLAQRAGKNPQAFLRAIGVQGINSGAMAELANTFAGYLENIYRRGMREALKEFIGVKEFGNA